MRRSHSILGTLAGAALTFFAAPTAARAHCDTMDGPVVVEAMAALASGDVEPVLKWVPAESEPVVRDVFRHTLAVRALGPEAMALADRYFFETLVRIHRQGEGEPYTGLRRAGSPVAPVVVAADRALDDSSVDELSRILGETLERGLKERFARAVEARKHASESVEKGRAYVAAYVELVHHAERLQDAAGAAPAVHDDHSMSAHAH
jgi:Family of unknown function (DUF6448)